MVNKNKFFFVFLHTHRTKNFLFIPYQSMISALCRVHAGNGTIDYEEFCVIMKDLVTVAMEMEERIKSTFASMDLDGDGKISNEELKKVRFAHSKNKIATQKIHVTQRKPSFKNNLDIRLGIFLGRKTCSKNTK